jgi:transposase
LRRLERVLQVVHVEARAADAAVKAEAAQDPIAMALRRLPGVGPVLSLVLRAEIGTIDRFARGPSLACYAGIVSRLDASAGQMRYGRITRAGSPWLRWALVEVAMRAMKRPDALGRWARRLAIHKGIKKARVALARRLCDEIVQTWQDIGDVPLSGGPRDYA